MAELSQDQIAIRMGSMGLTPGPSPEPSSPGEEQSGEKQEEEQESGEQETVDASDTDSGEEAVGDSLAGESGDDADTADVEAGDEGSDEESDEPKGMVALALEAKKEAEERERKLQSRLDKQDARHRREMQQFYNEIQQLKNPQPADGGLSDISDDEMVDGKTLKSFLANATAAYQQTANANSVQQRQNGWVGSQPYAQEVAKYVKDNDLADDPDFSGMPTDSVGLYNAVRARMLEEQLAAKDAEHQSHVEKELAKLQKKLAVQAKKPKVPPTGGGGSGGGTNAGNTSEGPVSEFERRFLNSARAKGLNPIVTLSKG